ncbi:MAG: serine protease [Candidatus Rokubacteria bacterium]|nr:serine protease [Candidatus Rokubacteria bacterium]
MRRPVAFLLALLGLPAVLMAAPTGSERRPEPSAVPGLPAFARAAAPAVVGLRVQVPGDRPSAATLGVHRSGSAVIFDPAGLAITVSYLLLDAEHITVALQDGRRVPGRLVGLDLEAGLGVIKLAWPGPWPAAPLGDSTAMAAGDRTVTLGITGGDELVATHGRVVEIRRYSAPWEYLLDRAFIVSPANPAFGGAALVGSSGRIVGVTSLRLGEGALVNLAIPIEKFLASKDELLARGRVESRRPRPWLGLVTETREGGGVVVQGVSPVGPAAPAGFRPGDLLVTVGGRRVSSQEEFYARLWEHRVGEPVDIVIERAGRRQTITVRPADRYRVYRTTEK